MDSTQRFSNRVDNYVKYRPHYPKEILEYLKEEINLNGSTVIADIGSGTGILTELFLQNGNKTFGVEPNAAMRLKGEELLNNYKNFISINATAEATTLNDASVDLIIAGQAFHWFDAEKTKKEFKRIAKANAYAALIWNNRQTETNLEKEYDTFLLKYATDYTNIDHKNITPDKIEAFFHPQKVTLATFSIKQVFNYEELQGRLLSSSYISLEENEKYHSMMRELKELFEKYQTNGIVKFNYTTNVYLGRIKA
jgi:ubiquinone/menaquinone biosynthesis C-methylase UbiE